MKKPNAVLHMAGYGLAYGFMLVMLYSLVFLVLLSNFFDDTGRSIDLDEIVSKIGWTSWQAFLWGALPGGAIGFVEGWLLWLLTWDIQPPLSQHKYASAHDMAQDMIGGLTVLGAASLFFILATPPASRNVWHWVVFLCPSIVPGGVAVFAVHRYMLKLRTWAKDEKIKTNTW
jgi:hypothetical protein